MESDMVPNSSEWIDTSYVQNSLRKAENDESIKVLTVTIERATEEGQNFLSDINRLGIELSRVLDDREIREKRSFIIKIAPTCNIQNKTIKEMKIFDIEISMMLNTLPRLNQILSELGVTSLSPRCLLAQREDPMHLLLEDLILRGFQTPDRRAGLDLDHSLLAFQNLGRFHASSLALKEKIRSLAKSKSLFRILRIQHGRVLHSTVQNDISKEFSDPKALAEYTMGTFHKDRPPMIQAFFNAAVKGLAKEVSKWQELNPRIAEKLFKLSEVLYEKGCEAAGYRDDEFNVLNHGDFAITNILFKYNESQKPVETTFVDFQFCHYGSPAVDILYFFGTSPSEKVRMNNRDILLREYHKTLTNTMAKLKCKTEVLSFNDLQEILRRRALYEAIPSFIVLPTMLLDKNEVKPLHEVFSETEGTYNNPGSRGCLYRKVMTRLLPLYDSMGLLDV